MDKRVLNTNIGQRVRLARLESGKTQTNLASLLGISRVSLSDIERSRRRVRAADLVLIAQVLGRPIDFFYPASVHNPMTLLTEEEQGLHYWFNRISSPDLKRLAVRMVKTFADTFQLGANHEQE